MALPEDVKLGYGITKQFYNHLTRHIVPGPKSLSYFIPLLLLPMALLIPPSTISHRHLYVIFLPAIYACLTHSWLQIGGLEVISLTEALWSFVLLVLRDPRRTFRRVRIIGGADKASRERGGVTFVEEGYPDSLAKRLPWVLTLMISVRLGGWKIGDPSHDKTQTSSRLTRTAYLKHALALLAQAFLILDATSCYVLTDAYFVNSSVSVDEQFPPPSPDMPALLVILRMLPPRLVRSSVLAGQVYAMVISMFYLPTIPAMGLNAIGVLPDEWSPHSWSVFFGSFSAIGHRGLRGLWGSWWHQLNRYMTSTPGRRLAQAVEISTESTLGYGFLTLSAFFFSGVIHMGMIPPEPKSKLLSANLMRLYLAAFFWAQIPAFQTEVLVSKLVAKFAPSLTHLRVTTVFVLLWVAAWLSLTLPILTVPFREIGYWHQFPLPVSLVRGLAGQGCLTWPILADS